MSLEGENLVFRADESEDLLTMLASYINHNKDEIDASTRQQLEAARAASFDRALFQHFQRFLQKPDGADAQVPHAVRAKVPQQQEGDAPAFAEGATEFTTDNSSGAFSAVFSWAAKQLQEGTAVLQTLRQGALASGFEDNTISRFLGSPDEGLAERITESALRAGQTAVAWEFALEWEDR